MVVAMPCFTYAPLQIAHDFFFLGKDQYLLAPASAPAVGPAPLRRDGAMKTQDSRARSGIETEPVEEKGDLVQTHTHGLQRVRLVAPLLDNNLLLALVPRGTREHVRGPTMMCRDVCIVTSAL
jgi:hypothetical protein